jgi:Ca-activated chloride channel homolog
LKFLLTILLLVNPITFIAETNERQTKAGEHFRAQDYRKALQEYLFIIENLETTSPEIFLNTAHAYFNLRNADKSAFYYSKLLDDDNSIYQSVAFNQLGYLATVDNDLNNALKYFKLALLRNPQNEDARYNYELTKKLLPKNVGGMGNSPDSTQLGTDTLNVSEGNRIRRITTRLEINKEGKEKTQKTESDEDKAENKNLQPEKLEKLKLNQEKAEAILNALKNQESKYIQQRQRPKKKNADNQNKPDW